MKNHTYEETLGETSAFLLLSGAATLLTSACIVWDRSVENSQAMARAFYGLAASLSVAALLYSLLVVWGVLAALPWLFRLLIYRGWIVIGAASSSAPLSVINLCGGD